jgi:hypothetical protein
MLNIGGSTCGCSLGTSLALSSRRGALLHQKDLMLPDVFQFPPKIVICDLCQQFCQVGVSLRTEIIVVVGSQSIMLSLTALFDIFVKIDADNIRLVVIGAVELNGPDPEWSLIFDLFSGN